MMPALPVSGAAISICAAMFALYISAMYLRAQDGQNNMLASAVGLSMITFNTIILVWQFCMWVNL
jgi:hypothetical protein